jgi:hypothetical protein
MGKSSVIQHELISKKMKPVFEFPTNKVIDLTHLKNKTKPLKEILKPPGKPAMNRKDYDQKWDSVF